MRVAVEESRPQRWAVVIIAAAMVAASLHAILDGAPPAGPVAVAIACAVLGAWAARGLWTRRGPILILDDQGFEVVPWTIRLGWDAIAGCEAKLRRRGSPWLFVHLKHPEHYPKWIPRKALAEVPGALAIPTFILELDAFKIAAIGEQLRKAQATSAV